MGGVDTYTDVIVEAGLSSDLTSFGTLVALIAFYVFQGICLQAIAQRRGLRNSWLAWVPVGNVWLLGSISDQYQYLVKGNVNSRRKIMLAVGIAVVVAYMLSAYGVYLTILSPDLALGMTLVVALLMLAFVAGIIVLIVFHYLCYYDLFRSCDPANGVLFLLLAIFFPQSLIFILFALRNRDGGMPPRRKPEPAPEEPEEEREETEEAEKPEEKPEESEEEPIIAEEPAEEENPDEQEIPVADA